MSGKLMDTYKRMPVAFASGKGSVLVDASGKEYLDFTSGIGVNSLGHGFRPLVDAISSQAAILMHVSNYYDSVEALAFARELTDACGMDLVFLCNSGAEANEGAIKIARKFGEENGGRKIVVTLERSFHGRTVTTLSATGQEKFHRFFGPFTPGFRYVPPDDIAALEAAMDDEVCALLLEAVQGESGVRPVSPEYLKTAARLAKERDALLMIDEIQTGMGRSGSLLISRDLGLDPDVVTLAKGLGGGIPIGAVLAKGKAATVLGKGDHGSTFGGNPLAAVAGRAVLRELGRPGFMEEVKEKGRFIRETLAGWNHPAIKEIRGRGLMIGVELGIDAWPVLEAALAEGLLILAAGQQVIRFMPPLNIGKEELKRGLEILKRVLFRKEFLL